MQGVVLFEALTQLDENEDGALSLEVRFPENTCPSRMSVRMSIHLAAPAHVYVDVFARDFMHACRHETCACPSLALV